MTVYPCLTRIISRRVRGTSSSSTHKITALAMAGCSPRGLGNFHRFGRRIHGICGSQVGVWQKDLKAGEAFACSAETSEGDVSSILLNDSLADPQSKPRTLCGFGGEEGLKEVPGMLGIDADAGVAYGNPRARLAIVTSRGLEDMQPQPAAIRHRLHRVAYKVQEDLFEFHRESLHCAPASIALFNGNLVEFHPTQLQLKNVVEQLGDGD